jgi:hypothetical protein
MDTKRIISFVLGLLSGVMVTHQIAYSMPFGRTQAVSRIKTENFPENKSAAVLLAATNLKIISNSDLGAIDIHQLKEDFVGKSEVSKFDTYVDNNGKGKIVLVKKADTKVNVETGMTVQEAKNSYPATK